MSNNNILKELNICDKEDVISDLIRFCFLHSKHFREFVINKLCSLNYNDYSDTKIYTRKSFASGGIPDILLIANKQSKNDIVIIENKLKAEEGYEQTTKYSDDDLAKNINNRFGDNNQLNKVIRIFLTLYPDQIPESNKFTQVTYESFLEYLDSVSIQDNPRVQMLLSDWLDLLRSFYKKKVAKENDLILPLLSKNDPLDGNYLYFLSLFENAKLPEGLNYLYGFRSSARGRRFYGAILDKDHWHTEEMIEADQKGSFKFQDGRNYSVHFEPQFDVINKKLTIYLHYELNWYETEAGAKQCVVPESLKAYLQTRNEFILKMKQFAPDSFAVGGGWNQVGKLTLNIDKSWTVGDFWSMLYSETNKLASIVDKILVEINK